MTHSVPTRPRIWFDVQDLLDYVSIARRPSGIQRVCLEIYAALNEMAPERIGFVAHDSIGGGMRCLEWQEVIAHCAPLSSPDEAAPSERVAQLGRQAQWSALRAP